jgi:exonuclease III
MDQLNYNTDLHYKCREFLTGLEIGEQFHDVFRTMYPDRRSFTWRENVSKKRARLDVAMASPSLLNNIKDVTHEAHPYKATDHSTLLITFDFNRSESGPGIFRCSNSRRISHSLMASALQQKF